MQLNSVISILTYAFSMGLKLDRLGGKKVGPDPCAYNVNNYNIGRGCANKWSFGSPSKSTSKKPSTSMSPGPGAYVTKSMCFDYQNPKFYLGNKIAYEKGNKNPGAGTYNP